MEPICLSWRQRSPQSKGECHSDPSCCAMQIPPVPTCALCLFVCLFACLLAALLVSICVLPTVDHVGMRA